MNSSESGQAPSRTDVFRGYLDSITRLEWLGPAYLARHQAELIERLVRHAHENVPFYRERLQCLFAPDGSVDLRRWHDVPVLGRDDAAANMAAIQTPNLDASYGPVGKGRSSGTTGAPLSFTVNGLAGMAWNAARTRLMQWHGVDLSRKFAVISFYRDGAKAPYPDGRTARGWNRLEPDSVAHHLDLETPPEQQVEWLLRHRARYLTTSPSNAMAIAYAATPEQARAFGIEFVFSFGETVVPGARELVADRLGAKLVALYSCEEAGPLGAECPEATHYHVLAYNAVVEILGEDGRPAAPGEIGRVIVTGLYNYATPLIRYAIGDVAWATGEPCRCGRSLPVIGQVEGRTRCAFVFRDGRRVWPRSWDAEALRAFVPYREFQMIQLDHERVEFRYVPDDTERVPDLAGLAAHARRTIHPSIEMSAVPMEAIPRGPGGKLEQFVSRLA